MILSGLLNLVNKYLYQKNVNKENLEETSQALDEFFDKSYGSVQRKREEIEAKISIMNKIYDDYNNITKPPKIKLLDKKESQKREALHTKAINIVKKTHKATQRKDILIPNLVNFKGIQVDRKLQHVLCPNIETMSDEEMIAFNNKLGSMNSKEASELIKENLKKYNDFTNDVIFAKSDEEFLRKCEDKADMLNSIGELQINDTLLAGFKKMFGGDLEPETIKEWKSMTAKGVDMASVSNRLGLLMDPNYCVFETEEAEKMYQWLDENDNVIGHNVEDPELNKIQIPLTDYNFIEYEKKWGTYIAGLQSYKETDTFHSPEFDKFTVGTSLKALTDEQKIENPIFKDNQGNVIDKDAAIERLYNNKHVDIYNGEIFTQSAKIENKWFSITKPKDYTPLDFIGMSKETLNKHIDNMSYMLDKGNPWYMKARNIIAPNDYQKMCNILSDLKSDKKYDKEKTVEAFRKLSELSSQYLNRKETDAKDKSDLTNERIEACTFIHDYATYNLSLYNKLEKDLNNESSKDYETSKKELKERIVVNEADDLCLEGLEEEKVSSNDEIVIDIDGPSIE